MTNLYGENLKPYKDIKIIKFCKVCGVEFRPKRYSSQASIGLCIKHRREYYKELRRLYGWKTWSPEKKKEVARKRYPNWLRWVRKNKKNIERRRATALKSYHRRKNDPKNKARKHVATRVKNQIPPC